jgi:Replicase family
MLFSSNIEVSQYYGKIFRPPRDDGDLIDTFFPQFNTPYGRFLDDSTALSRNFTIPLNNPAIDKLMSRWRRNMECSDGRGCPLITLPQALAFHRVWLNIDGGNSHYVITLDLDRFVTAQTFDDLGIPRPNFIVHNPATNHSHVTWVLTFLVYQSEFWQLRKYKLTRKALILALDADDRYHGPTTQNPFHHQWRTEYLSTETYTLDDLTRDLDPIYLQRAKTIAVPPNDNEADGGAGRNTDLFRRLSRWGHLQKEFFDTLADFHEAVFEEANRINATFAKGPKPPSLIRSTARNVARFVWEHHGDYHRQGVMGLDRTAPLSERQQQGQAYTAKLRTDKTVKKIADAAAQIRATGQKLSKIAVARRAGLDRETVRRYWSDLGQINGDVAPANPLCGGFDRNADTAHPIPRFLTAETIRETMPEIGTEDQSEPDDFFGAIEVDLQNNKRWTKLAMSGVVAFDIPIQRRHLFEWIAETHKPPTHRQIVAEKLAVIERSLRYRREVLGHSNEWLATDEENADALARARADRRVRQLLKKGSPVANLPIELLHEFPGLEPLWVADDCS